MATKIRNRGALTLCPAKSKGLTLIEILIALAIIAILAGIGYPMYTEQVDKAHRADAQGALFAFANAMEQYAAINPNTGYAGAAVGDANSGAPKNSVFQSEAPLSGTDKTYDLTLDVTPVIDGYSGTYTLTATPKGKMAGDGCGSFTLSNTGDRAHTGLEANCWK